MMVTFITERNNCVQSVQGFLPYAKLDHFKIEESSARSLAEILNCKTCLRLLHCVFMH